jgi:hypothetical protein
MSKSVILSIVSFTSLIALLLSLSSGLISLYILKRRFTALPKIYPADFLDPASTQLNIIL